MNKAQAFDMIQKAFSEWISDWTWEDDASPARLHSCLAYVEAIIYCVKEDDEGSDKE